MCFTLNSKKNDTERLRNTLYPTGVGPPVIRDSILERRMKCAGNIVQYVTEQEVMCNSDYHVTSLCA